MSKVSTLPSFRKEVNGKTYIYKQERNTKNFFIFESDFHGEKVEHFFCNHSISRSELPKLRDLDRPCPKCEKPEYYGKHKIFRIKAETTKKRKTEEEDDDEITLDDFEDTNDEQESENLKKMTRLFKSLNSEYDQETAVKALEIFHSFYIKSFDQFTESFDFDDLEKIGSGTQGNVYLVPVAKKGNPQKYVVKVTLLKRKEATWEDFKKGSIKRNLKSIEDNNKAHEMGFAPFIHTILEKRFPDEEEPPYVLVYTIMDYVAGVTMANFSPFFQTEIESRNEPFQEAKKRALKKWAEVFDELIKNLRMLHREQIFHGDLNPNNIMILENNLKSKDTRLVFIDFSPTAASVGSYTSLYGIANIAKNNLSDNFMEQFALDVLRPMLDFSSIMLYFRRRIPSKELFIGYYGFEEATADDSDYYITRDMTYLIVIYKELLKISYSLKDKKRFLDDSRVYINLMEGVFNTQLSHYYMTSQKKKKEAQDVDIYNDVYYFRNIILTFTPEDTLYERKYLNYFLNSMFIESNRLTWGTFLSEINGLIL